MTARYQFDSQVELLPVTVDKIQQVSFPVQRVRGSITSLGRLVKITVCYVEPPLGVTLSPAGSLANSCYPLHHVLQYPPSLLCIVGELAVAVAVGVSDM